MMICFEMKIICKFKLTKTWRQCSKLNLWMKNNDADTLVLVLRVDPEKSDATKMKSMNSARPVRRFGKNNLIVQQNSRQFCASLKLTSTQKVVTQGKKASSQPKRRSIVQKAAAASRPEWSPMQTRMPKFG